MTQLPFRYWHLPDQSPATRGACWAAATDAGAMSWLIKDGGVDGLRDFVKVVDGHGAVAPVGCEDLSYEEHAARQATGRWVKRVEPAQDPAWTGTELGALVPEADATEAHAVSAGGLAYCPRVTVEGVVHRLVRYTDRVAPDALAAYTQLTAEEVTALAATEVR